jgi:hypothetical protein
VDAQAPGQISFTFAIFALASLIPIFKNAKKEAFGPLTPAVEQLNGRAAMLGFSSLLIYEAIAGKAFF